MFTQVFTLVFLQLQFIHKVRIQITPFKICPSNSYSFCFIYYEMPNEEHQLSLRFTEWIYTVDLVNLEFIEILDFMNKL